MANQKSTPIIVIGGIVFVVGAALAFVLLNNNSSSKSTKKTATPPVTTPVTLGPGGFTAGGAVIPSTFTFTIPPGLTAVAVQLPFIQGLGGFAKAGDIVNIYATINKGKVTGALNPPEAKLIVSNVPVLEVLSTSPTLGAAASTTYLLALDPGQAEQVIFFTTNESLYFSLVPKNAPPATTTGRSYQNAA
jgi:hypothetical protein